MIAASRTVRVIGPAVSCDELIGTICACETNPTVGLNPTTPFIDDGQMMDPFVSVPTVPAARLAAAAAPLPELEPHGDRSRICGLRT